MEFIETPTFMKQITSLMSDEMFSQLLQSMKEGVAITNGKAPAARVFSYPEAKVEDKTIESTPHSYTLNSYKHSYAML